MVRRTCILCVDDDAYLTDLLHYALAHEGYAVLIAHNGGDAMSLARSSPPDAIILDLSLPDVNALTLCERFRTMFNIPVILLSARAAEEDVVAGFQHDADDFVPKPFSMQVLIHRLRAILRNSVGEARAAAQAADVL